MSESRQIYRAKSEGIDNPKKESSKENKELRLVHKQERIGHAEA